MLVLGINTVENVCEAALVDGVVVAEVSEPMSNGHDARLAPLVDRLMKDAGVSFSSLSRIAAIVGPGSFTGVRVGVAFARGLSLALDTPSVGVTSLEALEGLPLGTRLLGLLPAKRRPPERTWWAQVLDQGRGVSEPTELDAEGVRLAGGDVDGVCGGLDGVPDIGKLRIPAMPTARAAAFFTSRLDVVDRSPARPIYVREPDARPMERP
jgi:tRNA threonylcarbamoyladenosine biosynthesis protein TsaB